MALQPSAGMGFLSAWLMRSWKIDLESWAWREHSVVVLHQLKNCKRVDS